MNDYVTHETRMDVFAGAPEVYRAMAGFAQAAKRPLGPILVELIQIRASQLNGCAFCLDMHVRDARKNGEDQRRLDAVAVWREAPFFTARERAALELTESVTLLAQRDVSDEVWQQAAKHFDESELAHVLASITVINSWNRFAVATRQQPPTGNG